MIPKALQKLIDELSKFPGVGPRTAQRLAFHILRAEPAESSQLADALEELHESISFCETCHHLSENIQCGICLSQDRDLSVIAVVEEPYDVIALEKSGAYRGLYHVLGGVISPIDGVGPEQLNINSLIRRLKKGQLEEIILATNPSTEGEATALYIQKQLEERLGSKVNLTRLARGLPMGSDLEYADQVTLGRALEGRQRL